MKTLVPASNLLTAVGDGDDAWKLSLASKDWFDLQNHVAAVLALPFDFGEYEDRYGDASSGLQMRDCFDAMRKLRQVVTRYGNPAGLRARILADPNFLAGADRPERDVYSSALWIVQHAHQDASSLASTLRSIPDLARDRSATETVAGIKSLFVDAGQILDRMGRTRRHLDALIDELREIESELEASQLAMKTFTDRSSTTRTALDKEIGELEAKVADLEKARDAAYDKWLALTISAVVVPAGIGIFGVALMVLLSVPTGGTSFAVGSAVTGAGVVASAAALGTAAGVARGEYDSLVEEVQNKHTFIKKRLVYRHDLGALDQLMKFSLPASNGLVGDLLAMRDAWQGSIDEFRFRVADLTPENLGHSPWMNPETMGAAAAHWGRLDGALKAFIVGSFVDSNVAEFGSSLPADDPHWQQHFVSRIAA